MSDGAAGERRGTWPPVILGAAWLVGLQLAAYTAMRLVFHAAFRGSAGDVSRGDVARAYWLGLRFDLRVALLVAPVLPLADLLEPGELLDVGSGNGSPGLVLALLRPRLDVTLLEPRQRRWAFLREAARAALDAKRHNQ